jgi:hypothetical protein
MLLGKTFLRGLHQTIGGTRQPGSLRRARPGLERLEDRTVLSGYTASTVADLIADINAANAAGGSNTITLVAGKTFTLTKVDNTTDGATGLPVIAGGDKLTIVGNGDTIERNTASGTKEFRLFDVTDGASLSLSSLTLQGGVGNGGYYDDPGGAGGAIICRGNLSLSGVTVRNNLARGSGPGMKALGGGIFIGGTSGSLTMQDCTVNGNRAIGTDGRSSVGGSGLGGGLCVSHWCSASLTNVTLSSNTAQGGRGEGTFWVYGPFKGEKTKFYYGSGEGVGGGVYVAPNVASAEIHMCTASGNSATGGAANSQGIPGYGSGGGLFLGEFAPVCLDDFTVDHVTGNTASSARPNIDGSYTTCS